MKNQCYKTDASDKGFYDFSEIAQYLFESQVVFFTLENWDKAKQR